MEQSAPTLDLIWRSATFFGIRPFWSPARHFNPLRAPPSSHPEHNPTPLPKKLFMRSIPFKGYHKKYRLSTLLLMYRNSVKLTSRGFTLKKKLKKKNIHCLKSVLEIFLFIFEFGGYPTFLPSPNVKRRGVERFFYYFISIIAEIREDIEKGLEKSFFGGFDVGVDEDR